MWDTNGSKYKHMFKKLRWHKKASGNKYEKAIASYVAILKREEREWETKLLKNAKQQSLSKLKKYGIKMDTIRETLENKWLKNLLSKVA